MDGKKELGKTKVCFDKWSESYDKSFLNYILFNRVQKKVKSLLPNLENKRILDAGCGTASLIINLSRKNPNSDFVGVDVSKGMLEKARKKAQGLENLTLLMSEISELSLAENSFDYIISTISFHHWPKQEESLKKLHGFLKPKGKLIIADLSTFLFGGPGTVKKYSPSEMRELFLKTGFKNIEQTSATNTGKYGYVSMSAGIPLAAYGIATGNPIGYFSSLLFAGGFILSMPDLISKITIGEK